MPPTPAAWRRNSIKPNYQCNSQCDFNVIFVIFNAVRKANPAVKFDYSQDFKNTDFRAHPELYQIGIGEQGVLSVEPYKSEILPYWRFKTPEVAQESADAIYALFLDYKQQGDFVGMDMARKFLQMGYTRARRYSNHKGGRKYAKGTRETLPPGFDAQKAAAAEIFKQKWQQAREDQTYLQLKQRHRQLFDPPGKREKAYPPQGKSAL
ncbi:DUF4385 domain-containing protein [Leptolyngbya sp. FACHB-261]|uniref:DUF4385 domain-containing protein n=1 Tax=Leptolyngbya sp. FACHB-261 TaxID=2692806 RepID=UPI001684D1D7|nr:DUF4385 domain-containing protein [Leptolyngbya sp. FACHB-261]MBD2104559.1 DUF4385 domain-containing protein [Leptolyngbya sp. FACHB-261]